MAKITVSPKKILEMEVNRGEEGEAKINEPVVNTLVTKEPTEEIEAYLGKNDIRKFVDDTYVTQELIVGMENDQEDKETIIESIDNVVVTQELATEVEKFHPQEAATPSIHSACGRTPSPNDGWCFEKIFLLLELQKWKQQGFSLLEGVISLKAHKRTMDSLREKWLKEEWDREWESHRHKDAMKKKNEQLYKLNQQVLDLTDDKTKLCDLAVNLLACRWSSPSYLVLLWGHYYLFKLK